jgi:hypothetical protein
MGGKPKPPPKASPLGALELWVVIGGAFLGGGFWQLMM